MITAAQVQKIRNEYNALGMEPKYLAFSTEAWMDRYLREFYTHEMVLMQVQHTDHLGNVSVRTIMHDLRIGTCREVSLDSEAITLHTKAGDMYSFSPYDYRSLGAAFDGFIARYEMDLDSGGEDWSIDQIL